MHEFEMQQVSQTGDLLMFRLSNYRSTTKRTPNDFECDFFGIIIKHLKPDDPEDRVYIFWQTPNHFSK